MMYKQVRIFSEKADMLSSLNSQIESWLEKEAERDFVVDSVNTVVSHKGDNDLIRPFIIVTIVLKKT